MPDGPQVTSGPQPAITQPPPGVTTVLGEPAASRQESSSVLRAFAHHRLGLAGLIMIAVLAAFCFLGPIVYHTNQVLANIQLTNLPPGRGHPLGTDDNGYDILGRLMTG